MYLAFNHNMIFCRAITINWNAVNTNRRKLLIATNHTETKSWLPKKYDVGDPSISHPWRRRTQRTTRNEPKV